MLGVARAVLLGDSGADGAPPPPYTAQGVRFDSTNDWLSRGGLLTGTADGPAFTLSFWVKLLGGDTAIMAFLNSTGPAANEPSFHRMSNDKFKLQCFSPTSAALWVTETDRLFNTTTNTGWHHVLIAGNLVATPVGHFFVDDASEPVTDITAPTTGDIRFTNDDWGIGGDAGGSFRLNAEFADIWFDLNFLDITVETNRRKFIDAVGKPVDLGATGQLPTGSDPILYHSGPTVDWHTNKGTGGGFTENGALTDAASSPSD